MSGLSFRDRLRSICHKKDSLLCVGLDPDPARVPQHLKGDILAFNRAIVEATAPFAAAFKLNAAFYEALGDRGWEILRATFEVIPDDALTIYDAKRGDIGNSSRFYARSAFEILGADAATVNAYMGYDAVAPFLEYRDRGTFVLCLTSNPGAMDFQYIVSEGRPLYEHVALTVRAWNGHGNCGLVVGATRPEPLGKLRTLVPDVPFLVPGIGAQGGEVESAVRAAVSADGFGALFNVSRSILYASSGTDFAASAAEAARRFRDEINRYRPGR